MFVEETLDVAIENFIKCHGDGSLDDIGIEEMRKVIPKLLLVLDKHDHRFLKKG